MGKTIALTLLLFINIFTPTTDDKTFIKSLRNTTFTAKVIRIMDGDTMEVLYKNYPIKIRLAHIDCPEKRSGQPFNSNAKIALSNLCFGQQVSVVAEKTDRYYRLIATIINNKQQNVNKEMVKQGIAWHYVQHSKDVSYTALEKTARAKKIGLWQDPKPIAPWEWRKPANKTK